MSVLQKIIRNQATGLPLVGASVEITRAIDSSVPPVYAMTDTGPGAALGTNTVVTDSTGAIRVWVADGIYNLTVYVSGTQVAQFKATQVGGYAPVVNAVKVVNVEDYPYSARPTDSDSKAAIRQAIVDLVAAGEPAVLLLPRSYNISGGLCGVYKVPDFIDIIGLSRSDSGLKRIAGEVGPTLELQAYTGRSGGVRRQQAIKHLCIDGNVVGLSKTTGTVTTGSDTITAVADTTIFQPGYLVEGIGIPPGALVNSITVPGAGGSVKLTMVATGINGTRNKIVVREAYTKTVAATINDPLVLTSDTSGVQVGMRVFGTIVPDDPDLEATDLNAWTRVKAINPGVSITLDRGAKITGSGTATFFVANDGILITEVTEAPSYDAGKEYGHVLIEDVEVTQSGYTNVCARPGRDQLHMVHVKLSSAYGYGLHVSGCNDCYFERTSSGSNWYSAIVFSAMATPRWSGEAWQTYLMDRYFDVRSQGVREIQFYKGDFNGRLYVKGKTDEAMEIVDVDGINFKWTASCNNPNDPAGTAMSYIHANSATVVVRGGGFKPDRTDGSRPRYLGETSNGGQIVVQGTHWPNDTADATCPYSVDLAPSGSIVDVDYLDDVTGKWTRNKKVSYNNVNAGDTVTLFRGNDATVLTRAAGGTIASLTVRLPASPKDGDIAPFSIMPAVTALTVTTTDGWSVIQPPTSSTNGQQFRFVARASNTSWYPSPI